MRMPATGAQEGLGLTAVSWKPSAWSQEMPPHPVVRETLTFMRALKTRALAVWDRLAAPTSRGVGGAHSCRFLEVDAPLGSASNS